MISNDLRLSESVPVHHYWFQFPFLQDVIMFYESITSSLASLDRSHAIRTLMYTRKNHINHSNQLRLSHYMAFTYLDWLSRKDRNLNWEQRCSKHNRIGFGTCITVYIYVPYTSENWLLFRTSAVQLDL